MTLQDEDSSTPEEVVCSGRCGVALCDRRALISHDASVLLVPSGSCIRVFSLASGEPIRTLYDIHEAFIIALCSSPLNRVHVLSCSVDGVLARWDSTDYAVISKKRIVEGNCKVQVFLANRQNPWFAFVSHEKVDGRAKNSLWLSSLTSEEPPRLLSSTCSSNASLFGISTDNDLLAWIGNDHQLHVLRCSTPANVTRVQRARGQATCIAVHPTDELVAVGDENGAIFIHAGPFCQPNSHGKDSSKKSARAPVMKLHWHSMPVADLHVSANFLYSAGSEGVLVRWDLESDERQFLPRLGMPIRQLAVAHNGKYVVCAHTDNTITVVQAPNTVHRVIQGLVQRGFAGGGGAPADLSMLVNPSSGQLVLSGRPGQLQFYNLMHDRQAFVLDVTGENLATDFKLQYELKKGVNSEVILADFSPDGRYLATVEYKTALSATCKLKFWRLNEERGELEPNTTALMPHLHHRPRALRMGMREGRYFCVSAGNRSFKLWTIVRGESEDQLFWQCVDERHYRQMQCRVLAISEDHSILAASFGHIVTLWHVNLVDAGVQNQDGLESKEDLRLIGELCTRGNTQEICGLEFGHGECSTVLLSATTRSVTAWDILSLDRLWSAQVPVRQVLSDPGSSNIAALVNATSRNRSSLVIFRPDKTIEAPVAQVPLDQDDQIRCIVWVPATKENSGRNTKRGRVVLPHNVSWQTKSILLAMGRRDKLFHFVRREDVRHADDGDQLDTHQMVDVSTNVESLLSPFGVHLSSLAAKDIRNRATANGQGGVEQNNSGTGRTSQRAVERLLQVPTHVMPSASILAEGFIKALWLDDEGGASKENGVLTN
ncbi:WD repeat-containing protein 75-like, partial [Tropilaelaps mercedesae]